MKKCNARSGCPRIPRQINRDFGLTLDKDTFPPVLVVHYKPDPSDLCLLKIMKRVLYAYGERQEITVMSDTIYKSSKLVFQHNLKNLSAILKQASRDARERNIDPAVLLHARLAPDMHPLVRQIQMATDQAKGCCSRLADVEIPVFPDEESTVAELEDRLKRTLSYLRGLKASQFVGSGDRKILMKLPVGTLSFNGLDYLNGFALPNFYFHYTTAYNILRHNGVGLGKMDFLGAVPGMETTGKIAKMMAAKSKKKTRKKT